jgi:Cu/Ag efflux protein CusF
MNKRILSIALLAILASPTMSYATSHSGASQNAAVLTDGEVRKVDKEAKKITIRHGPIQNLDMPPMTMVFQVQNPQLLDTVKPGDKVKFAADSIGGAYTVTRIEAGK